MVSLVIDNLKKIDNPLALRLVDIVTNNLPVVEDEFYESTVYESKDKYRANSFIVKQGFSNNFGKQLVETPLTYVRGGNVDSVWTAAPGQGITTGVVLIDYITKRPLLLVVVDKSSNTYKYESVKFNKDTNEYETLTSKTKAAKSVAELAKFVSDNIALNIKTFETV